MKDAINTVGKGLYRGKRSLHEILAGAQRAEKLEEATHAKGKALLRAKTSFIPKGGKARKSPPPKQSPRDSDFSEKKDKKKKVSPRS